MPHLKAHDFPSQYPYHSSSHLLGAGYASLHVLCDLLIALSYFLIFFALLYFVRQRRDLPFHRTFLILGVFIIACGTGYLIDIGIPSGADNWRTGLIRAITASASVLTAVFLALSIPQASALPGPDAVRREIAERRRAENALHMAELELELRVNERTVELRTINEGLLHEIEQCKQLEQTLKESEEQLRLAQEASGLGLWDLDPRADRAVWSAQHFRIFGFEPSARRFDLMSFVSLIHPDDRAAVEAAVRDALRPDGQFDAEYRIQRQDGQLRWVLSKGQTYCDESGEPCRMIGVTLDVTERRHTAEELGRSEERFRLLVESIADYAIYMLDPEGFVSSWNTGAERIKGYRSQEIVGRHFSCFYTDEDLQQERPLQALQKAALDGRHEEDGWRVRKDGSRFRANTILTSLRDQKGGLLGYAKITRDLTASRRAEEAVQTAQAELARVVRATTLGELTASIAHEISQPLTSIVNNANASIRILAGPEPDLEEVNQAVAEIAEAGTRTGEIISGVRALLKKASPERRPLDMNQVIHEVLALMQHELEKHTVALEVELESATLPVLGDRVALQQVLLNLIVNGVEAMQETFKRPRVLSIRSENRASGLEITVKDSGSGLDPQSRPHIFDTFFTTKPGGMGMGLSISRSIIEAHKGRLWTDLDSTASGTSFHLFLPAYQP